MGHPWRTLRDDFSEWHVESAILPVGILGFTDHGQQVIYLSKTLGQAGRRSTLAHELQHVVHKHRGAQDAWTESQVEQAAARLLIPFPKLLDAMKWARRRVELAEELWVDLPTLAVRMAHLHPSEIAQIRAMLAERNVAP
jgi:Zn-dependent peptidase ImmA (M78 family)